LDLPAMCIALIRKNDKKFSLLGLSLTKSKYPFPYVGSPNNMARLLSFNAPANISLALAVPLFT